MVFTFSALVFAACKNDSSYKMANLKTDFYSVSEEENVEVADGKLKLNYSIYQENGSAYLQNLINNTSSVYSNINDFNTLLDNSLAFTYAYIDACSSNAIKADGSVKNAIQTNVKEFTASFKVVSQNVKLLADIVGISKSNTQNDNCMFALKNLFDSYISLYKKAVVLNDSISQFYYNYAISNSNPNVVSNYSASAVINLINSRVQNQISALTQNYLERFVFGSTISRDITKNNQKLNLSQNSYIENVNALYTLDITQATERANAKQDQFYALAVKLYNLQGIMSNDHNKVQTAYSTVDYLEVNNESSANEKLCAEIIEDYSFVLQEYNTVLVGTLNLISSN